MEDFEVDSGIPEDLSKALGKILDMYQIRISDGLSHNAAISELAEVFMVDREKLDKFVLNNREEYFSRPNPFSSEEKVEISQMWNGYCPESLLKGKDVRMRLNKWDFYESEETGLQIALVGLQAVILKFRGEGKFRSTLNYADEIEQGELLSPQTQERYPFNEGIVFLTSAEIDSYIQSIT